MNRSQAEAVIVSRVAPILSAPTPPIAAAPLADAAPRAYLADPIQWALSIQGIWTIDPSAPSDAEVGQVGQGRQRRAFLDLCELRVIETAIRWFTQVTFSSKEAAQHMSDFRDSLEKQLAAKRAQVVADYPEYAGRIN